MACDLFRVALVASLGLLPPQTLTLKVVPLKGGRSLVPKRGQCANLVVTICVSSSHIAYGSIRMEPVFMILGQSGATVAVLAIDGKLALQDVPYAQLRERMLKDCQVLEHAK